ncbi:arylacetamide deacetylase-like [Lytechinus variegatus]|nr:arylacetamide deacetylase-like [Lytechinus variegatus]
MKKLLFACILFGAFLAFLLHTPVPDGLTEPWKYRLLIATMTVQALLAKTIAYFQSDSPRAYIQASRYILALTNVPSPSEVKGSNIRSKVTTFDGVRVRLYELIKKKEFLQPALIYIHGGGYVFNSPDTYDRLTRDLSERLNMVVVSIDYRLAPEHPFPAGHLDCLHATSWFLRNAQDFGVDANRVAISGDSAGGIFSATVSQVIHDDPTLPNLKLQILVYPATQILDFLTPSYQKYDQDFGDGGVLPRKRVAAFLSMYDLGRLDQLYMQQVLSNEHITKEFRLNSPFMGYVDHSVIPSELREKTRIYIPPKQGPGNESLWRQVKGKYLDARFKPLIREDLSGLPQAFVATCGFDGVRDDGIFYAKRLEEAGVKTHWKHYPSAFHGVMFINNFIWFQVGEEMRKDIVEFVQKNV